MLYNYKIMKDCTALHVKTMQDDHMSCAVGH